ncbi:hypothetical protein BDP27DRAFT_81117 [Rhodocollybia butyracea]|uniref:Uncharacterized protein n=1 Tax=Rhodocollybia butyracea TaxID=206335 RepID=A0A9P5PG85_9AGAR|nr:hypothetical protein BDP27DRAFT_81117 [Rhodocollybia butyracea]
MLITHHWLGFILAVLISSTFAAPMPEPFIPVEYKVRVLHADGNPVDEVQDSLRKRIDIVIREMAKTLRETVNRITPLNSLSYVEHDTEAIAYYELIGGTRCLPNCYGFVITTAKTKSDRLPPMLLGAIISPNSYPDPEYQYIPPRLSKNPKALEMLEDKTSEFRDNFGPLKEWKSAATVLISFIEVEAAKEEAVKEAAEGLLGLYAST